MTEHTALSREEPDIATAAIAVLRTAEPAAKARGTLELASTWRSGVIPFGFGAEPDERPGRPTKPTLLPPGQMPKRGKAGSRRSRTALLHAICHIELNAIDLALDIVARFGGGMPPAFTDDWIAVAEDEARHFLLLDARLAELDCHYGDLPAHDGLWQSAYETRHRLDARLAVVPMVLEARGLDVTPGMIERLRAVGDHSSADALHIIYREEIGHVATGRRWFSYVCGQKGYEEPTHFQELVRQFFKGQIKPPFNESARTEANLPVEFYAPLAEFI